MSHTVEEFKAFALDVWENHSGYDWEKIEAAKRTYGARKDSPRYDYLHKHSDLELVDQQGGEDQGSSYYVVYEWEGEYFKVEGSYDSEYGVDWGWASFEKVTPKKRVVQVTDWEEVYE